MVDEACNGAGMKILKLLAVVTAGVFLLLACAGEADAGKRKNGRAKVVKRDVNKYRAPKVRHYAPPVPSPELTEPKGDRLYQRLAPDQWKKVEAHRVCMDILTKYGIEAAFDHVRTTREGRGPLAHRQPERHGQETCAVRAMGLEKFMDETEVRKGIQDGKLVPIDESVIRIKPDVPLSHRHVRPWTADYLYGLQDELHAAFRSDPDPDVASYAIYLGSVLRTLQEHQPLVLRGKTPADCRIEELCSSHTTGVAVDISRNGMPRKIDAWLRERLEKDQQEGEIFYTLEVMNNCFHVVALTVPKDAPVINRQ